MSGGSIFVVLQNILESIGFGNDGDVLTSRGPNKFPTFQIASGGVNIQDEGIAIADNPHTTINFVGAGVTVVGAPGIATVTIPGGGGGTLLQRAFIADGAVATGTTIIPIDDTIPQQTEGDEFMALTITPLSATSELFIDCQAIVASSVTAAITGALFRDAIANALVASTFRGSTTNILGFIRIGARILSTATVPTTIKFRAGPQLAATVTFNGFSGGRVYGGVSNSYIRILEIEP